MEVSELQNHVSRLLIDIVWWLVVIQFTFQITISAQPPPERERLGSGIESLLYISDVYKM